VVIVVVVDDEDFVCCVACDGTRTEFSDGLMANSGMENTYGMTSVIWTLYVLKKLHYCVCGVCECNTGVSVNVLRIMSLHHCSVHHTLKGHLVM